MRPEHVVRERVAVVTVSFGSSAVLPAFLDSVPGSSRNPVRAVVADNAAEPEVAVITREHGDGYLALPENKGYGSAVNAAVRLLPSEIVWILVSNPDVMLGAGAIDTLVAAGESDPGIAAVGPAILTAAGEVYPSARSIPSLRTGVGHALFSNLWIGNPWTRAYRNERDAALAARDAGWLSGACLLIRRDAFDALGGFDEGYFMYFEDVDLGFRLGRAGWRNRYEPAARVVHIGAHSTSIPSQSDAMIDAHHRSARRFLRRKYRGWWLWPVRATLDVGLTLRSAIIRRRVRS